MQSNDLSYDARPSQLRCHFADLKSDNLIATITVIKCSICGVNNTDNLFATICLYCHSPIFLRWKLSETLEVWSERNHLIDLNPYKHCGLIKSRFAQKNPKKNCQAETLKNADLLTGVEERLSEKVTVGVGATIRLLVAHI